MLHLLRSLFGRKASQVHGGKRKPVARIEVLEDRTLLSAAPVVISQDDLHLGSIGAMAVSSDAHKVYLGRVYSPLDAGRLNLAVLTLDDSGKPVGAPTLYADSALPLPLGGRSSLSQIVVDPAYHKLYLTTIEGRTVEAQTGNAVADDVPNLTVYDLDANGNPVGSPRTYATDDQTSFLRLAVNSTQNRLYLGSSASAGFELYNLDASGEPEQGTLQNFDFSNFGSGSKTGLALSPDGKTLYSATNGQVEMVRLDSNGLPEAGTFQRFLFDDPLGYVRISCTPQALYLFPRFSGGYQAPVQAPEVWALASDGAPVGTPQVLTQYAGRAFALDGTDHQLWVAADDTFPDAYTQAPVPDGVTPLALPLDGSMGSPASPPVSFPVSYGQAGELMAVSAQGTPVLLTQANPPTGSQVSNYYVQVTIEAATSADGTIPTSLPVWLSAWTPTNAPEVLLSQSLPLGQPSSYSLDSYLKDVNGPTQLSAIMRNEVPSNDTTPLQSLTVQLDVYQGDPAAGGTLLKSMTQTVTGDVVSLIVPGYGFLPPGQRSASTELMTDYANQVYLAAAEQVGLTPDERPRQFVIGADNLMGGYEASTALLQAEAQTLALLGINTVDAYEWNGIPTAQINAILDSYGFQRRQSAAFGLPPLPGDDPNNPTPGYFDFVQKQADVNTWLQGLVQFVANGNGGAPGDVVDLKLTDEPAWYYPSMLQKVANNPAWLQAFHDYLQEKGFTPAYFGSSATDWSSAAEIVPIGASKLTASLESHRLFYWSMRYFSESAAKGMALLHTALQRAFPNLQTTDVNFNGWPGTWYTASPNQPIANNTTIGPDTGMGWFDWMTSGRLNAHTLWTEDWSPNGSSEQWSFLADAERSAALEGTGSFGGYVSGNQLQGNPAGASYQILSLIGHGAKTVDLYAFGPAFQWNLGNTWSEDTSVYASIADALKLVGRSEDVLYPGQPSRGKVAILLAGESNLWDDNNAHKQYDQEVQSLYYALSQAGYTVDFVDDTDLAQGALSARGYTTLYVTSPNLSAAAESQVIAWVGAGGTLAVTPGGGVADEYNTPFTTDTGAPTLDTVLGLKPGSRTADRDAVPAYVAQSDTLTLNGHDFGTGSMALSDSIEGLQPGSATVEATLASGGADITLNHYGKGTAIAYGFFPGRQFFVSPGQADPGWLPTAWGQQQQQVAVEPAVLANTPRPVVVSQDGVEADLLTSDKGDAIVLLNWTDQPLSRLTVTVPDAAQFTRVRSAQGAALQTQVNADGSLTITLPLANVDVLTLDSPEVSLSDTGTLQVGALAPGSAHTITIENVSGGVRLTLDGQQFQYAAGQVTSVVVNGGASNDTVNAESSPAGVPITLNLGGVDVINLAPAARDLAGLGGTVTINGSSADTLTIDDGASVGPHYVLTAGGLSRTGAASIQFSGLGSLVLNAGLATDGGNDIVVQGTAAGTATTVNANGNEGVAIGNERNVLDDLRGPLTVHGTGVTGLGGDDGANPAGHTYTFTATGMTRDGIAPVTFTGVASVQMVAGTGNDAVNVVGVPAGGLLHFYGGGGANTFTVSPTAHNLDDLPGILLLSGSGPGPDGGTAALTVNDQANAAPSDWHLENGTLVRQHRDGAAVTRIDYRDVSTLTLNGGGGNVFTDAGTAGSNRIVLNGGAGANTLVGANATTAWSLSGLDSGRVGSISFTGVQNLLGGSGADTFAFGPGGGLSGTIDGGGGVNTLDYSGYGGSLLVDLPLGLASLVGRGIRNIRNVVGGRGNAILVGNGDNTLRGGTGRNLLIAGGRASVLVGNKGEDILIGGATAFDTRVNALLAIMAEWARPGLAYTVRVNHLLRGGGLNRGFLLTGSTVHSNRGGNTLLGGPALDLFFGRKNRDHTDQRSGLGELFIDG
jgi:hypothetical protein